MIYRLSPSTCAVGDHELAVVQLLLVALVWIVDFSVHRRGNKFLERQWSCAEHKRRLSCRVHQGDDGAQGINRATTRNLEVHFNRVIIVLFVEHSLNVKLLRDLAVECSPSR